MEIATWVVIAVVAFIILKFFFKPLFKVLGLVALALVIWWFFGDDISAFFYAWSPPTAGSR